MMPLLASCYITVAMARRDDMRLKAAAMFGAVITTIAAAQPAVTTMNR
ncbi:hypothetical protein [Acidisphaera sp. L21]|nr:hypothetical protein [Acidisphaera sp. L21]